MRQQSEAMGCRHDLYHDVNKNLPAGARTNPRQTWVMYLWPHMEQSTLAMRNNFKRAFFIDPGTIRYTLNGLTGQYVPMYYCPSDIGSDQTIGEYQRRRGNYVVNWGNVTYKWPLELEGIRAFPMSKASTTAGNTGAGGYRLTHSNTLMMSETLKAWSNEDNDWRGDIQNDEGNFRFQTRLTPNTSAPDIIESGWYRPNVDPTMPAAAGAARFTPHGAVIRRRQRGDV